MSVEFLVKLRDTAQMIADAANKQLDTCLQTILKEHNGFCHIGTYKYWAHQGNLNLIDRRKK